MALSGEHASVAYSWINSAWYRLSMKIVICGIPIVLLKYIKKNVNLQRPNLM
jgi:hypothetical protein